MKEYFYSKKWYRELIGGTWYVARCRSGCLCGHFDKCECEDILLWIRKMSDVPNVGKWVILTSPFDY